MKEKVVIYGATSTGQRIYYQIKDSAEVIAFVDEDDRKWGGADRKCKNIIASKA